MENPIKVRHLLGGLTAGQFLRQYWQKKALLVRQAFHPFSTLITRDRLIELATSTTLPSRLIIEHGGRHPWDVEHGPFRRSRFRRLPKRHWTLLVQGVDRRVRELGELLEHFQFIPNWRIEDVMISYAVKGGNVGAHVDDYDVFLIQAGGEREWQIGDRPLLKDDFQPGLDLRLLRTFRPAKRWILKPGDMLYLPPRIAHHGIAMSDDCVTFSVGFRAPSHQEILSSYLADVLDMDSEQRYGDADICFQRKPGLIGDDVLQRLQSIVDQQLLSPERLLRWFGKFVTEPLEMMAPAKSQRRLPIPMLRKRLQKGWKLHRSSLARMSYALLPRHQVGLFVNGEERILPKRLQSTADLLTRKRTYDWTDLQPVLRDRLSATILQEFLLEGIFELVE